MILYPLPLSRNIANAINCLHTNLQQAMPVMARPVIHWMGQLAGTPRLADYFQHPLAFPSLLLPWWAEQTISGNPDENLQADLVYSTINGYYYIRLIDNFMDGDAAATTTLLPALGFFHTQFHSAYQPLFAANHPFWQLFKTIWFQSAEAAMHDATLAEIDKTLFTQVAAKKVCAAKIPLAAVCHRYHRPDLIELWSEFVDIFGGWHQLHNDLFDWHKDHTHHTHTYFLSEAERKRHPDESAPGWVAREGFAWGVDRLQRRLETLNSVAARLQSPPLLQYLDARRLMLQKQTDEAKKGLHVLEKLMRVEQ